MSLIQQRLRLFLPRVLARHHGNNPDKKVQVNPKPVYRRLIEEVTRPIYPEELNREEKKRLNQCSVLWENQRKAAVAEENPFAQFLLRRIHELFTQHRMLVVISELQQETRLRREQIVNLRRGGLTVHEFPRELMRQYVKDGPYQNMLPLMPTVVENQIYVTGDHDSCLQDLVSAVKKTPDFILLGGLIEGRLMRKSEIERRAQLPPVDHMLGETTSVLALSAQRLRSNLQSHQQQLCTNLSQHVRDREGEKPSEPS